MRPNAHLRRAARLRLACVLLALAAGDAALTEEERETEAGVAAAAGDVEGDSMESILDRLIRTETVEGEMLGFDDLPADLREQVIGELHGLASQLFRHKPTKRLRGQRFTVLSDLADDEDIQRISSNLDETFEVLDTMFGTERPDAADSIQVYVYRQPASFDALAGALGTADSAGFYLPIASLLAFGMNVPSGESIAMIMIHEATHAYMDRHVCPERDPFGLWFEEGVADYVGSSEIRRGELRLGLIPVTQRVHYGKLASRNVRSAPHAQLDFLKKALRKEKSPTLDEILSADRAAFYGEDRRLYYAGSWMLIHYLRHGGEDRGKFLRLVDALCQGKGSHEALREVYGDLTELEARYRRYVRQAGY
jgi:hypothetical protein